MAGIISRIGISFAGLITLETGFTAEHAWLGHPLRERPLRKTKINLCEPATWRGLAFGGLCGLGG